MSVFQQARHSGGGKVRQPQVAAGVRDEDPRITAGVRARREAVGEIDLDAEAARELGVGFL
jgi:hypothetical protein